MVSSLLGRKCNAFAIIARDVFCDKALSHCANFSRETILHNFVDGQFLGSPWSPCLIPGQSRQWSGESFLAFMAGEGGLHGMGQEKNIQSPLVEVVTVTAYLDKGSHQTRSEEKIEYLDQPEAWGRGGGDSLLQYQLLVNQVTQPLSHHTQVVTKTGNQWKQIHVILSSFRQVWFGSFGHGRFTGCPKKTHFQNWLPLAFAGQFLATRWITVLIWWPGIDQRMLMEANSESVFFWTPCSLVCFVEFGYVGLVW